MRVSCEVINHGHAPELLRDLYDSIFTQQFILCKIIVANDNRAGETIRFNAIAYVTREHVQIVASAHCRAEGSSYNKSVILHLPHPQQLVTIAKESNGDDTLGVAHFNKMMCLVFKYMHLLQPAMPRTGISGNATVCEPSAADQFTMRSPSPTNALPYPLQCTLLLPMHSTLPQFPTLAPHRYSRGSL